MACWWGKDRSAATVVAALTAAATALVSAAPGAAATPTGAIKISAAGQIGTLRLNVSTAAGVRAVWGKPDVVAHGKPFKPFGAKPPRYTSLGYQCHPSASFFGGTACNVQFYFSGRTHRLVSFQTTLHRFALFGGIHVGMPANRASTLEHHAPNQECLLLNGKPSGQIHASSKHLQIELSTRGGHAHGGTISGGTVDQIAIDSKPGGVGVAESPC